jgi:molybdopterin-guanine dinucleotide biosynthesis protein B
MTPVVGIAGWKNSGKTTLTTKLIAELTRRGYRIASVKHAHHEASVDQPGTDSYRHREAGAREVALVTSQRWAVMHELKDESEPTLAEVLARLSPADLVIVEGYTRENIPKIEVRRLNAARTEGFATNDSSIVAIAADHVVVGAAVPTFDLDDIDGVTDFVISSLLSGSAR